MLKYAALLFILSFSAIAMVEDRKFEDDFFIIHPEERSERELERLWKFYLTDKCEQFNISIRNEANLRYNGLRRCRDNTVSFVQPSSRGVGGWEGKCGHTFAANSFYTLCKKTVSPDEYFGDVFGDITPGVRPSTLRKGLNSVFKKNKSSCPIEKMKWKYSVSKNSKNYIASIKKQMIPRFSHPNLQVVKRFGKQYFRNPVGALIQNPGGKYIHWVKIIDILESQMSCQFVVNHWDNQYQVPCQTFALWASKVGKTYPIILKSFSLVSYQ